MTLEVGGFRLGFQEWSQGNITEQGTRGIASSGLVREAEGQKATTGLSILGHAAGTIQNQEAATAAVGNTPCLQDLSWQNTDAHAFPWVCEAVMGHWGASSAPCDSTYQQKPHKWQKHGLHVLLLSKSHTLASDFFSADCS